MGSLRIIAGEFKGRKISVPKGRAVRPTSDRVRESIFALLGDVEGCRVLDLYAGSGALGIEALSRGASEATFVDSAVASHIRKNLEQLGLADRGHAHKQRCERFLELAVKRRDRWNLFFIDPPYRLANRLMDQLQRLIAPVMEKNTRIVVESSYKKPLTLKMPKLVERQYGDTLVSIYRACQT